LFYYTKFNGQNGDTFPIIRINDVRQTEKNDPRSADTIRISTPLSEVTGANCTRVRFRFDSPGCDPLRR